MEAAQLAAPRPEGSAPDARTLQGEPPTEKNVEDRLAAGGGRSANGNIDAAVEFQQARAEIVKKVIGECMW